MKEIDKYLELVNNYPHYFKQNSNIKLVLDKSTLESHVNITGKQIGVIYESSYHIFIVDLIEDTNGKLYQYSRLISPKNTNGVVIIPIKDQKLALLKQFRHGTREFELEFPRGFSEPGISPEENAKKELFEELGAEILNICHEGSVISDTGLTGGTVDIFSIEVNSVGKLSQEEGISEVYWYTLEELKELIKENKIRDSFTLSAMMKYSINKGR